MFDRPHPRYLAMHPLDRDLRVLLPCVFANIELLQRAELLDIIENGLPKNANSIVVRRHISHVVEGFDERPTAGCLIPNL